MNVRADYYALTVVVQDSIATIEELDSQTKVRTHLKLLLRVLETASSTAKRLAIALKTSPEPAPEKLFEQHYTSDEIASLTAILDGTICPSCSGLRDPRDPFKEQPTAMYQF